MLVRLSARSLHATIEQYRASGMHAQDELADLVNLIRKVDMMECVKGLVRTFRMALHGHL